MANVFLPVPDWFAADNQGGGIAVGALSGDASLDLVVFMVDNPEGQNRGLYRVGRTLDDEGAVTGGWTPWVEVPDWFPTENQGGAIALADLDGSGSLDLVVIMVDSPAGQNQGLYRVGHSLDPQGNVTGGWSPWLAIPDWFGWENQGVSVAVSPPDDQGSRDLFVFTIDNGPGANSGLYRVGRNIDAEGVVSAWTPWTDVPDWFSTENAGCGVAVADLDGTGGRDLVVFHIDAPVGQNQAFYRIAKKVNADGIPPGGWGRWLGVPSWFGWENQGGGIAIGVLAGARKLFCLAIDNPPGQNAGLYEVLDLDPDPARDGAWEVLPFHSGVLAVHTALLLSLIHI